MNTMHSKLNRNIILILFLVFFIGENVLSKYAISTQIHEIILILLCSLSINKILKKSNVFPQTMPLMFFIVAYTLFKIFTGGRSGNTMFGIMVFIPVLIFSTFVSTIKNNFVRYKKILYYAYIIECGIALFERITGSYLFKLEIGDVVLSAEVFSSEFRSIGLYGHPLQNALIVFIFITFILVYEKNIRTKFSLACLGILAIFCFNTRAAIVMSISCFIIYLFYWLKNANSSHLIKITTLIIVCMASTIIAYLFITGKIGGRLSTLGLYDEGSAGVRVAALDIFDYYKLSDFLFGLSQQEFQIMLYRTGVFTIENFWLNWLFSYGLIFIIGLVLLYIPLIKKLYKGENTFVKIYLILPFIILASTNPSLAVSFIPMTAFLLLSYIMPHT